MKFPRSSGTKPSPKKAKHMKHTAAEFAAAEQIPADNEQVAQFVNRITTFLSKANGRPLSKPDLTAKCRGKGKPAGDKFQMLRRFSSYEQKQKKKDHKHSGTLCCVCNDSYVNRLRRRQG